MIKFSIWMQSYENFFKKQFSRREIFIPRCEINIPRRGFLIPRRGNKNNVADNTFLLTC
jgi:hypothetical protein